MPRVKLFDENEVLEKAMELFWKKGYHATSIQDLVNHLKINRASLYDTFGGKDDLFKKAFKLYRESNTSRLEQLLISEKSVKDGFKHLFSLALEHSLSDKDRKGCFVVNATTELLPGDEYMTTIISSNKDHFINLFEGFLQKGVEAGEISGDKDLKGIATMLFILYNGLQVVSKAQSDKDELLKSIDSALKVLD